MISTIALSAALALAAIERHEVNTNTQTIIFEVGDLLMEIPDFAPPDFPSFGFDVRPTPERLPRTDRTMKSRVLGYLWMEYPEARSISVWDGLAIVKLPRHEELPISLHKGLFGSYVEPAKKSKLFGDK